MRDLFELKENLTITEVGEELLVFDGATRQTHHLDLEGSKVVQEMVKKKRARLFRFQSFSGLGCLGRKGLVG